jgi:hypothetical protein
MTDEREATVGNDGEGDGVDVASADSFPASDAPAWAIGRARWRTAGKRDAGQCDGCSSRPPAPGSERQVRLAPPGDTPASAGATVVAERRALTHV